MTLSLLGKAVLFTVAAYAVPVALGWWLYGTKVRSTVSLGTRPPVFQAIWLAFLLGLSGVQLVIGGLWDASMHVKTGQVAAGADFLWPPHIMIYLGFLTSLLVGLGIMLGLARQGWRHGVRDPRIWFRQNPYLGWVCLASLYSIMSIPGDALWHEIFGLDLTAWSPPHLMLGLTGCAVLLSAVGLLCNIRSSVLKPVVTDAGVIILLAIALNMALIFGVLEWELPTSRSAFVNARPIWLYPVVTSALVFTFTALARLIIPRRWSATVTAVTAYALRGLIIAGLGATDQVMPMLPLPYLFGAVALDLATIYGPGEQERRFWWQAALFAVGYAVAVLPVLLFRSDLPDFTALDIAMTVIGSLAASLALSPLARLLGRMLTLRSGARSRLA